MGKVIPLRPSVAPPGGFPISDEVLALNLTVGQLRELIRTEMVRAPLSFSSPSSSEKLYLPFKEASTLSGIAVSTLRLYARRGEFATCKVGRRVVIKRRDLEGFVERYRSQVGEA